MNKATDKPTRIRQAQPWWAQLSVLVVVFVAGGLFGATMAMRTVHGRMQYLRQNPAALTETITPRLERILTLSDGQSRQINEIITRRHTRILEYRKQGSAGMHAEFDEMEKEIARVLSDQQTAKWHAVADNVRTRFLP